jgi:hypothetical protein
VSNITKKQTTLAVVAVVFAAAMIVGTIAAASDQFAFASSHKRINQVNKHSSNIHCETNGGSAISTGNGLLAGVGVAVAGHGGTNVCFDNNQQTNGNAGNIN